MRSRQTKWSDLAVVFVLTLLLGTISLAQVNRARETANRVKCASNLRQVGQAVLLYSNDNRGAYPRTTADINNPVPTWGTPYALDPKLGAVADPKQADPFHPDKSKVAVKPNDVTAAFFLLVRTQDITSDVFICPTTGLTRFDYGGGKNTPLNWTNWPGNAALAQHLSYSYQNPYPTKDAISKGFKLNNSIGAEFAIASDMNPGVDALLKLTPASAAADMRKGNSANHDFDGQNILYGDGHVAWESSTFVGVNRDNIYTFGESGTDVKTKGGDGIVGPSVGPNDSILLPTAKDLGVLDAEGNFTELARKQRDAAAVANRPVTPGEQQANRKRILGRYMRLGTPAATMTIEEARVTVTGAGTFPMKFAGIDKNKVQLSIYSINDPTTLRGAATCTFTADGLEVSGPPEVTGAWKKQ
jgi:prepilin-type processing-associated H-X9-DG protein